MSNTLQISAPAIERWFVLMVRPRQESLAASGLAAKGVEGFSPSYTERRRWSDRIKVVTQPLFPGYIFCRSSLRTPVLPVAGVQGFVSFAGRPEPVPEQDIEAILRMTASGLPLEPLAYLQAGDRVRVIAGPLAGVEGVFLQVGSQTRVVVGIELLGRSVSVEVPRGDLEACASITGRMCA